MRNFKKAFNIVAVALIAVSLTNCNGKDKEEEIDEVDTFMSDTESPEITDTDYEVTESEEITTSGSEDYDKMLDDYYEYVTEYVKFYKKAMKGDQTAMADYPAMMQKASSLQESMEKAEGNNELSSTQIGRMAKIQTKMLQAMQ